MQKRSNKFYGFLKKKSDWARRETLKIHKIAQETRLASSLSAVEIFSVLYYGKLIKFSSQDVRWDKRDRFIISKGHGAISLYPILADLGFLKKEELKDVCKYGSRLGGIPDPVIPGFETINGSLGHGLGVACGIAIALKRKKAKEKVFVLMGDGELYEGSVWEALMFAGEHKLDNLILIVDNNKVCMLDYCHNVIDLEPLGDKFSEFKWQVKRTDGHSVKSLYQAIKDLKDVKSQKPRVLIADTIKGKGVPRLEIDALSHIKNLKAEEVDVLLRGVV
ncbi:MAG: transketolase [Candidatus Omnitrophica bacterium CG11_big_fil_rev_8_21_14_0_20_43_6]|nr:MAG: transketolase [Candidatus Omnitrophica bacterium CG11_big_fil_rev_8_21_14_0_20_43_6]